MLVSQVQTAFGTYWTAHGYNALRGEDAPRIFARVNTYMIMIVVWTSVGIIAFSPPVLGLMSRPQFFPALQYVPWITLAYVLRAEADYFRFSLYLDGRTGTDACLTWTAAIICLAGYAFLIPIYKLWGAVVATLLAFVVLTAGAWWMSRRKRAYPIERRRLLHLSIPAVVISAAILSMSPGRGWPQWSAAVAAAAGYPVILYVTGFLRPGEKAVLFETVRNLWYRVRPPQATAKEGSVLE
jgi:O-antigen/teichoic acid export membrane protein